MTFNLRWQPDKLGLFDKRHDKQEQGQKTTTYSYQYYYYFNHRKTSPRLFVIWELLNYAIYSAANTSDSITRFEENALLNISNILLCENIHSRLSKHQNQSDRSEVGGCGGGAA